MELTTTVFFVQALLLIPIDVRENSVEFVRCSKQTLSESKQPGKIAFTMCTFKINKN